MTIPDPIYEFITADQRDFNWLTRVTSRHGEYGLRFHYIGLFCPECYVCERDKVFEKGFDPYVEIRVKTGRNILETDAFRSAAWRGSVTIVALHLRATLAKIVLARCWGVATLFDTALVGSRLTVVQIAGVQCVVCSQPVVLESEGTACSGAPLSVGVGWKGA